jgi:hypothetical protein
LLKKTKQTNSYRQFEVAETVIPFIEKIKISEQNAFEENG